MSKLQIIKIVAAVLLAAAIGAMYYHSTEVARAEKAIERAATRATVVAAVDSATRARIAPLLDSLGRKLRGYESEQAAIKSSLLLTSRKNENLNKQIDSLNARLGVRPRF